jgi:hypothetical protein
MAGFDPQTDAAEAATEEAFLLQGSIGLAVRNAQLAANLRVRRDS